jgi:hypothetical protein
MIFRLLISTVVLFLGFAAFIADKQKSSDDPVFVALAILPAVKISPAQKQPRN